MAFRSGMFNAAVSLAFTFGASAPAMAAADAAGFLETTHHQLLAASTVPDNGDQNPYAVVIAPVSAGTIKQGDVLVDNFNDAANLQGRGSTIVDYHPDSKILTLFVQIPQKLEGCPGGIGLSTAMTMLKSGWIIVGSTPSSDGTTATKGNGCLIVLDAQGKVAGTIVGKNINDPWGNMAVVDNGDKATLFVSNAGFGVGAPTPAKTIVNQATVLRLELAIPAGNPPVVTAQTVVASGLSERAAKDVFLIGPTGLALGKDDTLYVSDALNNRVVAIDHAGTRKDSAGMGREITRGGLLHRPLAMILAPNGHLLTTNGLNGEIVEIDPASGKQLYAKWINTDKAQTPPGNGNLFGVAMSPDGHGFYYVNDDVNTLMLAQ